MHNFAAQGMEIVTAGSESVPMTVASLTHCLTHQRPETGTSPFGPACPCCKQLLYVQMDPARTRGYWESQPAAYTLDRHPLFVYVRTDGHTTLRSLRPDA